MLVLLLLLLLASSVSCWVLLLLLLLLLFQSVAAAHNSWSFWKQHPPKLPCFQFQMIVLYVRVRPVMLLHCGVAAAFFAMHGCLLQLTCKQHMQ
jgi:hypothetical protein